MARRTRRAARAALRSDGRGHRHDPSVSALHHWGNRGLAVQQRPPHVDAVMGVERLRIDHMNGPGRVRHRHGVDDDIHPAPYQLGRGRRPLRGCGIGRVAQQQPSLYALSVQQVGRALTLHPVRLDQDDARPPRVPSARPRRGRRPALHPRLSRPARRIASCLPRNSVAFCCILLHFAHYRKVAWQVTLLWLAAYVQCRTYILICQVRFAVWNLFRCILAP